MLDRLLLHRPNNLFRDQILEQTVISLRYLNYGNNSSLSIIGFFIKNVIYHIEMWNFLARCYLDRYTEFKVIWSFTENIDKMIHISPCDEGLRIWSVIP